MKNKWGIGIAAAYITFAVSMVLFAVHASHQHYDLVSDNYYEQAVKYQEKIDAGHNAEQSKLSIVYNPVSNALELLSREEINSGALQFYKPDKAADDFKIDFKTNSEGRESIPLHKLAHGWWKVNASWTSNEKPCYSETKIFVK